jgi:hypothetical protein
MNRLVREQFPVLRAMWALRHQMLDSLTHRDLSYRPPGNAQSLGELLREMGELEVDYIRSFKTFKLEFNYHNPDPDIDANLERMKAWLSSLEAEMEAVLEGLSDEDLEKPVDRGGMFAPPVKTNFHIYREALLIFYGKASVYLKALDKPLSDQWKEWIG